MSLFDITEVRRLAGSGSLMQKPIHVKLFIMTGYIL